MFGKTVPVKKVLTVFIQPFISVIYINMLLFTSYMTAENKLGVRCSFSTLET